MGRSEDHCPNDARLAEFVEGALDAASAGAVESHIDGCRACRLVVVELARSATQDPSASREAEALGFAAAPLLGVWEPPRAIGELRIRRLLGRGGMGGVWLARDTLLGRDVAVKFGHALSAEGRLRARIEARAIARLAHPNILKVHRAAEIEDRPMLVTELLAGVSLDRVPRPAPTALVLRVGADLAAGLAAAHAAGVIHRDVKPANAFLCDDATAKLLDFGLARIGAFEGGDPRGGAREQDESAETLGTTGLDTASGAVVGTPLYMAPETWREQEATPATDVYSLGVLLFELVAGRAPFVERNLSALRAAALAGRVPDLRALCPSAPAPLVTLIHRCLRADPPERPAAAEVCRALEVLAEPPAPPDAPDSIADQGVSPYRGLLSFEAEHRGRFFGRAAETAAIEDALRAARLVLLIGASGAGKSSLARAGVSARLRGAGWRVAVVVPGSRPMERLALALSSASAIDATEVAARLAEAPSALVEVLASRGRALLVVDQLEEVVTLAPPGERRAFFDALSALAQSHSAARVLATLRADFLGRLEGLRGPRATVAVGPLSRDGLRDAIALPARARGVEIEPPLIEALTEAARSATVRTGHVDEAAGALPLVSFTLERLWERRDHARSTLGLSDLEALGGLVGALGAHADATLDRMTAGARAEARRILLDLVTIERTRARRDEAELRVDGAEAREALDTLVAARLVVASLGDGGAAYAIAHESLVTGWPRLGAWLDEEAEARGAHARLGRAAGEWERLGRPRDGLMSEAAVRGLAALDGRPVGERESAFLRASRAASLRRRRWRRAALVLLPLAAGVVALVAWRWSASRRQGQVAALVAQARGAQGEATRLEDHAREQRDRALALFDQSDTSAGEEAYGDSLATEARADDQRKRAAVSLDQALALSPNDRSARDLYGETLSARLRAAERLHLPSVAAALRAQLGSYDVGTRPAPAHVRITTLPAGARVTLSRVSDRGDGRFVESALDRSPGDGAMDLEPGSYVARASAPGYVSTPYPFLVHPGESRAIGVRLPSNGQVPDGMAYVPEGRFVFGIEDEASRSVSDAVPAHEIDLPAFFIGRTEVTWGDYLEFLRSVAPSERGDLLPRGLSMNGAGHATLLRSGPLKEGDPYCTTGGRCVEWRILPVANVDLRASEAFAAWRARAGRPTGARLCSEQEWERAARGADARNFTTGNRPYAVEEVCSFDTYGSDPAHAGWCEPGSHAASRSIFGVDDMAGNVWEWTSSIADKTLPGYRALRGGSVLEHANDLWLARRGLRPADDRSKFLGIRLCASWSIDPRAAP